MMYRTRFFQIVSRALAGVTVGAALLMTSAAQAVLVAHWPFEPNDLTVDISGNGNVLTNIGATAGGASPASGSTGSASFLTNAQGLHTTNALDLSPYDVIRISWWQQVTAVTGVTIAWEHSANYNLNDHGLILTLGDLGPGVGSAGQQVGSTTGNRRYNIDRFNYNTSSVWQHFMVEYDHTVADPADLIRIFIDGSPANIADDRNEPQTAFANDVFNIGARGGTAFAMVGSIDEMMIEGFVIPEPSSVILFSISLALLGCAARRRR